MKVKVTSEMMIPADAELPLSEEYLDESFRTILPEESLQVFDEWYRNTSDVLIARSSFGAVDRIHNWTITQIAIDKRLVSTVRQLLVADGLPKILEWFVRSGKLLNEDPTAWVCYSVTVGFENDKLIFDESTTSRPGDRPEPGWPKEPYRPSSNDKTC